MYWCTQQVVILRRSTRDDSRQLVQPYVVDCDLSDCSFAAIQQQQQQQLKQHFRQQ